MSKHQLSLPVVQNWSCHNCSGCCRQHLIEVTAEEQRRIESQQWGPDDGIPAGQPLLEPMPGRAGRTGYRLAHQPDGACVFLNPDGLCRIHAKYGEEAKPLPCRIYPYVFHPAGKRVAVSLRFSCPSVVRNAGQPVTQQQTELQQIAQLVVPDEIERDPPPEVLPGQRLDWPDTLRFVRCLDEIISNGPSVITQLQVGLRLMDLIEDAQFDKVRGARLDELLSLVAEAAAAEVDAWERPQPEPSGMARTQLRMLVAAYARRDTVADLSRGVSHRLWLLFAGLRFARGRGQIPALREPLQAVPFQAIESGFELPEEADEMFRRLLQVKLNGLHFCGRGYYGVPLAEGFRALALEVVAMLWIARWLAVSREHKQLQPDDIEQSIAIVDHHHGFSELLGQRTARGRVRILARARQISLLLDWYARSF